VEVGEIVAGIPGIEFAHFDDTDVVRHPLVQRIILAYERREPGAGAPPAPPGATHAEAVE
jgi:phosphate starvation-inducible protein PhoH